jgi:hypothetical protein
MFKKLLVLVLVVCVAQVASAALVAHYTFDDQSTTQITDVSGNLWNGPIVGSMAGNTAGNPFFYEAGAAGSPGKAWNVNDNWFGHPGNILGPSAVSGQLTVAFWAKANATMGSNFSNVFQSNFGNVEITCTSAGSGGNYTVFQAGTADMVSVKIGNAFKTSWHHYAYTKDVGTGVMNLYIDGTLQATATGMTQTFGAAPSYYGLGVGGGSYGSSPIDGAIDDFVIYDNALTEQEVVDVMNSIPEPATMILLGLGGLLLRRKG